MRPNSCRATAILRPLGKSFRAIPTFRKPWKNRSKRPNTPPIGLNQQQNNPLVVDTYKPLFRRGLTTIEKDGKGNKPVSSYVCLIEGVLPIQCLWRNQ